MSQQRSSLSADSSVAEPPAPPTAVRKRVNDLLRDLSRCREDQQARRAERDNVDEFLRLAPTVEESLRQLSQTLFQQLVGLLETKLTVALQEVLEQPVRLRAVPDFKRGSASIEFHIERDGQEEDILRGQGGSVTNILSVGLRMFALMTLPAAQHRRFLVLDEQDCWLRPDLVPRLVKIIHDAAKALGFQTLLISHHDVEMFEQYADRIYRFCPSQDGVRVELLRDRQADFRA